MKRLKAVLLVIVTGIVGVAVLSGCEALVANAAMDFSIALEPSEVTAAQGSELQRRVVVNTPISLEVLPMPIVVTLHDGPDFLSAEDLEIPPGITDDEMTFVLENDAMIGETEKNVKVRATNGFKTKEAVFVLTVRSTTRATMSETSGATC